ncbi:hypothetical protein PF005_g23462 [Phytophthora fragariae]|uniref:Uncharacterized protein n=2 Tax=Phytophthora TaxID=4783 RepID=A0A6A4BSV5_9STRA|nr:hypothetical protein PF003_g14588 [Phytophthora fragariae]KAE8978757.1 hypothetical protein PR001_g24753 [Phytophthora rubi]KAE9079371.1 hypothetical protein PF007_g23476 [Phytophthora fragariae]KAE9084244.1 hypothetical protein PF006_g26514 [Phytophthora fragariae]KAE9175110.1 hypothetical protein PF004_g26483 [Phytophthora fragariae]
MQPRHVVRDQLHAIVGYSKYHNVRIDNQVEANTLVPTLSRRKLLEYEPAAMTSAVSTGSTGFQ